MSTLKWDILKLKEIDSCIEYREKLIKNMRNIIANIRKETDVVNGIINNKESKTSEPNKH